MRIDFQPGQEGLPEAPDWLEPEGKAQWDRVVRGYADMNVLTLLDFSTLIAFCALWEVFVAAMRTKPHVPMHGPSLAAMMGLSARLGLDPVNRARLKAPQNVSKKPGDAAADPWAAITAAARPGSEEDRTADA